MTLILHQKYGRIFIVDNMTINNFESFRRKLNNSFNSSHPNIFNFIDNLKNIQSDTYILQYRLVRI